MARSAILPSNMRDPGGIDRLERGAMREFARRMRKVREAYVDALNRFPVEPVINKRYAFLLDPLILSNAFGQLDRIVDGILLDGSMQDNWFVTGFAEVAYQRGTGQAYANLSQQSETYKGGSQSLANLLRSRPYQDRISLVRARVFEEMKGLSGNTKANMGRILADGIGRGKNPREIAKTLREQAGIEARRANLIARTEIGTALRRARWDEAEQAREEYGIRNMLMHLSALSSATRPSHAARHGKLYEIDEVRDWYADGQSYNCKCSQVEILVDKDGNPVVPSIIERAKRMRSQMDE